MNETDHQSALTIFAATIDAKRMETEIAASASKRHLQAKLPYQALQEGRIQSPDRFANNDEFLARFLEVMQDNTFVDIGDFEIVERRRRLRRPLIALKQAIWSILRFYTYRLWSQQNDINGFMLAAIEGMNEASKERESRLAQRIDELEQLCRQPATSDQHPGIPTTGARTP